MLILEILRIRLKTIKLDYSFLTPYQSIFKADDICNRN